MKDEQLFAAGTLIRRLCFGRGMEQIGVSWFGRNTL